MFLNSLYLKEAPWAGPKYWQTFRELVYRGRHDTWVVPRGFVTDLASIPAIFGPIGFPRTHTAWNRAAVLHDWLTRKDSGVSRKDADGLMRRVVKESGGGAFRAWAIWIAIRSYSAWVYVRKMAQ